MQTTIMSIVFLAAVPTSQPVSAMSLDDLRREVAALRRENDLLRDRLAKLEAADEPVIDDGPKLSIRDAIKANKVIIGMSVSQARASMRGAQEAIAKDGSKRIYTWVFTGRQSKDNNLSKAGRRQIGTSGNAGRLSLTTPSRTIVTRTVTATAMDGKIVSVEDVAGE